MALDQQFSEGDSMASRIKISIAWELGNTDVQVPTQIHYFRKPVGGTQQSASMVLLPLFQYNSQNLHL
jgi:hypothetical protein